MKGQPKAGAGQVQDVAGGEEGEHQEEDRQLREHVIVAFIDCSACDLFMNNIIMNQYQNRIMY